MIHEKWLNKTEGYNDNITNRLWIELQTKVCLLVLFYHLSYFLRYAVPKDYVEAQNICHACLSLRSSPLYGPLLPITQPHF